MIYAKITTVKINKLINFILVFTTIFLLASCAKKNADDSPAPSSPTNNVTPVEAASVIIQNFTFTPATVYLKIGGSVTWTNLDSAPHSVTDSATNIDSKNLATNQSYLHRFPNAGTYTYHCIIHPNKEIAKVIVGN